MKIHNLSQYTKAHFRLLAYLHIKGKIIKFEKKTYETIVMTLERQAFLRQKSTKGFIWTERRSNQFILKEINPGISLEGMMLKLKLQYL